MSGLTEYSSQGRERTLHSPPDEAVSTGYICIISKAEVLYYIQLDRVGLFGCLATDSMYNIVSAGHFIIIDRRLPTIPLSFDVM